MSYVNAKTNPYFIGHKSREKQKLDLILSSMRYEIYPFIANFKKSKRFKHKDFKKYIWQSDISGDLITDKHLVQADHVASVGKSFRRLAYNFLIKEKKLDIATYALSWDKYIDFQLAIEWERFHADHAELQICTKEENIELWRSHFESELHYSAFYKLTPSTEIPEVAGNLYKKPLLNENTQTKTQITIETEKRNLI